ncbi:MAG TPA: glycosyl hydrolase 115 family protein [Opitutaceae bacterium]
MFAATATLARAGENGSRTAPTSFVIADGHSAASLAVDPSDYPVVGIAANLFADDVQRVCGQRPTVGPSAENSRLIIVGTLDHSRLIDQLAVTGKLGDLSGLRGHWETTRIERVDQPLPGVASALVIVGSDRRGTAYGLMNLSERIGVSPWYWWADVPPRHHPNISLDFPSPQTSAPAVKYRGIFINDEDWGLNPWARTTFEPAVGNIGPKTYTKVFELLLRLRLNYLWPAMHACTTEFASNPENVRLADEYGIVAGSSHCEPMLCNNVHWNEQTRGKWNYATNRSAVHAYWEENTRARLSEEAVWTLGIRGIHDAAMESPPSSVTDRITLLNQVISDQRSLIDRYVSTQWGPVAQCFVPYKEVLPIYDAGLPVPDDVTLVWVDDNFGYIRRLSSPRERRRAGGSGIYWHLSYYGAPHSYTWINTTSPALTWEELHKAWENDARTLWVLNVGDIKPAEIGIDYFARLAWNPGGFPNGAQSSFLGTFFEQNFGGQNAPALTALANEYYRLGTVHKPELMDRAWALSLSPDEAARLESDYTGLLKQESGVAAAIPAGARDAYTEMVGFPARVLGGSGLIFLADRQIQLRKDAKANQSKITKLRAYLEAQVTAYNTQIAGGKWNHLMPGPETNPDLSKWSSQVRWPWGETARDDAEIAERKSQAIPAGRVWRNAAAATRSYPRRMPCWQVIDGLGTTGLALALEPASLSSSWALGDPTAPRLEYAFNSRGANEEAFIDFLPTFRLVPGMKLRVAVAVDNQHWTPVEVPGSSGAENERGAIRQYAVQDDFVRARVSLPPLSPGPHTFMIRAVDPGAVIDRISLP